MTDYAHKLGLRAGWYGNNCICSDDSTAFVKYYIGDLRAFRELGFDSWKLDGCSAQLDMQLWDMLIDSDGGKPIEVENCHWGGRGRSIPSDPRAIPYEPTQTWCPWNMYRSSGDVRSNYGSIIGNLNSVTNFSARNLSYPGCWAYADMLEVGCHHGPGGKEDSGLSFIEARSHFGSWAIVSSPLTLSHDVNNDTVMDAIWPIISNREVIAVSQSYAGFSGGPFKVHNHTVSLSDINHAAVHKSMTEEEIINLGSYTAPKFQYFYKPLEYNGAKTAVLLMNHDNVEQDMLLNFADIPGVKCTQCHVRDIWNHKDLGNFNASIKATNVTSHDSVFLIITPAQNVQQHLLMRDMWVV
jgi:alpha-galactosidase